MSVISANFRTELDHSIAADFITDVHDWNVVDRAMTAAGHLSPLDTDMLDYIRVIFAFN